MAGALVTLPAAPALAEDPTVAITSLSNGTLAPGQSAELKFRVTNNNDGQGNNNQTSATVAVTISIPEVTCTGQCDVTQEIQFGQSAEFTAQLVAGQVAAGQTRAGNVEISATIGNDDAEAQRGITVRAAAAPPQEQTVREVSGKVIDERTGDPIEGAFVLLKDAKNQNFDTYTNEAGTYRFNGTADKPIAPGALQLGAQKDDVSDTRQINASANQRVTNVRLTLKITVAPTASATPEPTEPVGELSPDTVIPSGEVATPGEQVAASDDSGGGMGQWLVVLGGGLLVALGVGGIVWVLVRRRDGDEEDDDAAATGVRPAVPGGGPGGLGAAAAGGYAESTRMVPRASDPLADAPTMLHSRAPVDEFPDPYGAPMPQGYGGGYAQPTQQYGGAPQYGERGYNAPSSGGGYASAGAPTYGGPAQGGYDERYDEPTGRYQATNGYGPPAGYEQPPAGYRDRGGYEPPAGGGGYGGYDQGGYDQRGGYEAQPPAGYEPPAGGGYGGYDQRGGYEPQPPAGYDRVPPQRGGYDQGGGYPPNGYEQGGYYPEDEQPQQPGGRARHGSPQGRGDRRQLDWLDD